MVWSPPMVITRGSVFPARERPGSLALVKGLRMRRLLWPCSICWIAQALSYLFLLFSFFIEISYQKVGIRSHWDITAVQNPEVAGEWIRLEGDVVATTGFVSVTISK